MITRRIRRAVIVGLLSLLFPWMVHAEWIMVRSAGMHAEDPTLTVSPRSGSLSSLAVESQIPGDLKWLVVGLPVTAGQAIDAVELCYQTPHDGPVIRQVRLVEYLDTARGLVVHDDATALRSPTGSCYHSPVPAYTAADAVSLWLRLEFAQATEVILIHSVRIHVP